jgi:hypothetical protein
MHGMSPLSALGLAISLALCAAPHPAAAQAQSVKAPITIENLTFTTTGVTSQPVALPLSRPVNLEAPCGTFPYGTVSMSLVNNGIDLALDGAAFNCPISATLRFDVVLEVPVVGTDAVAFVALVPEAGEASLVNAPVVGGAKASALLSFALDGHPLSAELPVPMASDIPAVQLDWRTDPTTLDASNVYTRMIPLIPGDRVRIPIVAKLVLKPAAGGGTVDGTISARFEFQTRLPLQVSGLAPSLSIPIGVMGLTGLALMRS